MMDDMKARSQETTESEIYFLTKIRSHVLEILNKLKSIVFALNLNTKNFE